MIFNSLHCEPIIFTNTSWKRIFEFGLDFDLAVAVSIGEKKKDTLQEVSRNWLVVTGFFVSSLESVTDTGALPVYDGVGNSFRSLAPHVAQWLLSSYNTQLLLLVFLVIVSLFLGTMPTFVSQTLQQMRSSSFTCTLSYSFVVFISYMIRLDVDALLNTFKWEDYISWQRKLNEARVSAAALFFFYSNREFSAAALKASISGMSSEAKRPESKYKSFSRRSPLEDSQVVAKENKYDKGFFHNMFEVLFPLSTRPSFSKTKSKPS
ncbi:protein S-acyltransferase 17 [Populus alba x Populus x berolinensis]|uniref:Protein S-acyltransferase 17 n=1 Tax=Populus alba x Populus x berolinensis TaxID=444605 RepID=A0AAD6QTB5_9ROSI|nr:protein S-acyltransferase 17 [Populus alba x Populus x berolinensis]